LPGNEGEPNKQGFDYSFEFYDQRQAHTYYPTYLYENGNKIGLVSSYTNADGSSGTMADVWFRTKSANAPEVKTIGSLDDGAHHDISAGS
jgi:hypothetical protein